MRGTGGHKRVSVGGRPARVYLVPPLPPRPADGHKGTFGRVLVVGGSPEMLGAPVLAATAALRAGAGLVAVAVHRSLLPAALTLTPELVGHALDDRSDRRLLAEADKADVLVIGPGMGTDAAARRRLTSLLKLRKTAVLDADALTLLAGGRKWPAFAPGTVITPHPGEMSRLGKRFGHTELAEGDDARMSLARKCAAEMGVTVVLKGARTVVAEARGAGPIYIEPTAESALAKAGTGDVLAGMVGALLHVCRSGFEAAVLAVHLHARAGVLAGRALGARSVLARDVISHLPEAIRRHEGSTET